MHARFRCDFMIEFQSSNLPRRLGLVLSVFLTATVFIWLGSQWSESNYADKIISKHGLSSPEEVFVFIGNSKAPANSTFPVDSGESFIELMDRKSGRLWCDEGAIVLAVLIHRMGYKTRLVDLLDNSGISRHTVLQVFKDGQWIAYDFSTGIKTEDPLVLVDFSAYAKFRDYPNFFHRILIENYFIRYLFQAVRPGYYFVRRLFSEIGA